MTLLHYAGCSAETYAIGKLTITTTLFVHRILSLSVFYAHAWALMHALLFHISIMRALSQETKHSALYIIAAVFLCIMQIRSRMHIWFDLYITCNGIIYLGTVRSCTYKGFTRKLSIELFPATHKK